MFRGESELPVPFCMAAEVLAPPSSELKAAVPPQLARASTRLAVVPETLHFAQSPSVGSEPERKASLKLELPLPKTGCKAAESNESTPIEVGFAPDPVGSVKPFTTEAEDMLIVPPKAIVFVALVSMLPPVLVIVTLPVPGVLATLIPAPAAMFSRFCKLLFTPPVCSVIELPPELPPAVEI